MFQGCAMQWGAEIQWNSKSQILMSEDSQVKLRSIQTRVFDTTDRTKILRVAVATMQDLFFDIDVLDEDLGIVSGKKWHQAGVVIRDRPIQIVGVGELGATPRAIPRKHLTGRRGAR